MCNRFLRAAVVLTLAVFASGPSLAADSPKAYTVERLENGLDVIYVPSSKVPLVTIVIAVKAGAMTETPETNGLTHLWEHMFFKGNARIPNQEAFSRRVRQLGIVFNGDTAAEKVRYFFTLPSGLVNEGLEFMADAIQRPLFDADELTRERRVVLDEYERSESQPDFDFGRLSDALVYGDQAFSRDPLGIRRNIAGATREQLLSMKDQVFVPGNAALIVSGDIDPGKVSPLVAKHFAGWSNPSGWRAKAIPAYPRLEGARTFIMTRPQVENAQVMIVLPGPSVASERDDTYPADLLVGMLQHRSGRFYKKFVDSGLTYGASVSYYTQFGVGNVTISAETKPENAVKARDALLAEIAKWSKPRYFNETLREDVLRNLVIDREREVDEPSEFGKTLAFYWPVTGMEYYDSYLDRMRATTITDVTSFVGRYLKNGGSVAGILMSPEEARRVKLKDDSRKLTRKYVGVYHEAK